MHASEWPAVYLSRKEAFLKDGYKAIVVGSGGYEFCLAQDSGISDVRWSGDAVIISLEMAIGSVFMGHMDRKERTYNASPD